MGIKLSKEDIEAISTSIVSKLQENKSRPIVYSVKDVSEILKCHKNTVLNYIHSKALKAKRNGKGFDITQENLKIFLNEEV